jgi:hypothetical protein
MTTIDKIPDMSATQLTPPIPWEPLRPARNIDEVVRNLDQIIDWAIRADSTIGYFAVLYKRSTVAIRAELNKGAKGKFENRPQMEQFDVVFASRYFDALNAYFSTDRRHSGSLTLPWEVTFVGEELGYSTMLQHMVAGLNAHITFDLGIATAQMVPHAMSTFEHDFNVINAVVASQIRGTLDVVEKLSPNVRWIRIAVPREIWVIKNLLVKFRTSGWFFAIFMDEHPDKARQKRVDQMSWTSALSAWYLHPPEYGGLLPRLIRFISKKEVRNTAHNLQELNKNANEPDALDERFL